MLSRTKTTLILLTTLVISACSSGSSDDKPTSTNTPTAPVVTSPQQDNDDLFAYLKSYYFWNKSLPSEIDNKAWATMPEAMTALRGPLDRFSYVLSKEEHERYSNSIFFGYGFSSEPTKDKDGLLIRFAIDSSSAFDQGLRRGDIITHMAGIAMSEILANDRLTEILGPNQDGYTLPVRFVKPNGDAVEVDFKKSSREVKTVLAKQVKSMTINDKEVKFGYLVFDSFKARSELELITTFSEFAEQDVKELILDLRYNGGGLIRVARQLAEHIAGAQIDNKVFAKFNYNDLQASKNLTWYFNFNSAYKHLDLNRVVVLTSELTCSASEMLINSLTPFLDVVVIGGETCGKPVGMDPQAINNWVVSAINFQTFNAVDFGDYFNGFTPDCVVTETIPGDWGVESEALLAEGMYYLQNDSCSNRVGVRSFDGKVRKKADFSLGPIKAKNML